jgi:gas vesicle protein
MGDINKKEEEQRLLIAQKYNLMEENIKQQMVDFKTNYDSQITSMLSQTTEKLTSDVATLTTKLVGLSKWSVDTQELMDGIGAQINQKVEALRKDLMDQHLTVQGLIGLDHTC